MDTGLLAAVLANPEDDKPRLVLADSLLEQGDARGELIVLQCRLAGSLPTRERYALHRREIELLVAHGDEWLTPLEVRAGDVAWGRGFIEQVSLSWAQFVLAWPRFRNRCPLRHVWLNQVDSSEIDALCRFDWPKGITSLSLTGNSLYWGDVKSLANAPRLGHLTSLSLGLCSLSGESLEGLADAEHLGNLRDLDLFGNRISAYGMRALAQSNLDRLERLVLQTNRLGGKAMQELAKAEFVLKSLDLAHNKIGASGVAALTQAPCCAKLESLDLNHSAVGHDGLQALAGSSLLRNVRALSLGWNDLRFFEAEILASAAEANLEELDLRGNHLDGHDVQMLVASPLLHRLEALLLDGNKIDADGARAIANAPGLRNLRRLEISHNPLGTEGIAALASMPTLEALALEATDLNDDGCIALASSPAMASLSRLQIFKNPIGNRGAQALADSPHLDQLAELLIGSNHRMDRYGMAALIQRFGARVRL